MREELQGNNSELQNNSLYLFFTSLFITSQSNPFLYFKGMQSSRNYNYYSAQIRQHKLRNLIPYHSLGKVQ